jgi:putative ABC transport system permease protein
VVVDSELGLGVGEQVTVSGRTLRVVGVAEGVSYYFGQPTLFVPIAEAQAIAFGRQPLAMTIVTQGVPATVPDGLQAMSGPQVRTDLERPLASSTQTIGLLDALLLVVAAGIIGSILYLSALERVRDFAVLKATGASNRALLAGLALQALLLAAAAALLAVLLANLLAPVFPFTLRSPPPPTCAWPSWPWWSGWSPPWPACARRWGWIPRWPSGAADGRTGDP